MASFKLKEVPTDALFNLRSELAKHLPETHAVHGMIDIRLRYGEFKTVNIVVFGAANPKFKSFVCVTPCGSGKNTLSFSAYWDMEEVDDESVGKLLSNLPNWKCNLPLFSCFHRYHMQTKLDSVIVRQSAANNIQFSEVIEYKYELLTISKEDINIPKISSDTLPSSSASLMLAKWNFFNYESVEGLEDRLSTLKGVAAFHITKNNECEKRTLVSWTQQYLDGEIGMTYTLKEHRKRGLATVVTLTLAKHIINEGRIPYLVVGNDDEQLLMLYLNMGFKIIDNTAMSIFLPQGKDVEDITEK